MSYESLNGIVWFDLCSNLIVGKVASFPEGAGTAESDSFIKLPPWRYYPGVKMRINLAHLDALSNSICQSNVHQLSCPMVQH